MGAYDEPRGPQGRRKPSRGTPLFDPPPAQEHSQPSRDAAVAIEVSTGKQRERIAYVLDWRGREGATDHELAEILEMDPSTERPRRVELVNAGLVVDSGRTRPTRSGRQATVWVATEWKS